MINTFKNSTDAFEFYFDEIIEKWEIRWNTKTLFNVWFYIENIKERVIKIDPKLMKYFKNHEYGPEIMVLSHLK